MRAVKLLELERRLQEPAFLAGAAWGAAWAAGESVKLIMSAASLFGDPLITNDPICTALVETAKAIDQRSKMWLVQEDAEHAAAIREHFGLTEGEPK